MTSKILKNLPTIINMLKKEAKQWKPPIVGTFAKGENAPFKILISTVLSLRTKDETTLPASERLFALADTPQRMLKLSLPRIEKLIYPVGFYKTKARTIHGICRDIIEKFNNQVPDDIDTLLTMKGVGRKTANLVLTEGFHKPAMCVDTHVHRISNRFGFLKTKTPEETEWDLRKKLPKKYWMEYNALLVTWGQNICKPVSPLCSQCPVKKFCTRKGVGISR